MSTGWLKGTSLLHLLHVLMACKTIQAQDQEAHYRVDAGIENGWRSPVSYMFPLAEIMLNKQLIKSELDWKRKTRSLHAGSSQKLRTNYIWPWSW